MHVHVYTTYGTAQVRLFSVTNTTAVVTFFHFAHYCHHHLSLSLFSSYMSQIPNPSLVEPPASEAQTKPVYP